MPRLTRRSLIVGGSAAAIAFVLRESAIADAKSVYRNAIVIDGLGGLGNSMAQPGAPLAEAYVQDVRNSGLTCVHVTITPVGTTAPDTAFTETVLGIGEMEREIDSHPDVLSRIRTVADIAAAKENCAHGTDLRPPGRRRLRDRPRPGSMSSIGWACASLSRPTTGGICSATAASSLRTRASARRASRRWSG